MLALVLIYFVGKAFYDLAGVHQKNQWGYAILGVVSYYAGVILMGFLAAIFSELGLISFDDVPEIVLNMIAIPIGVLTCWGTYSLLKSLWSKNSRKVEEEILDGDLLR